MCRNIKKKKKWKKKVCMFHAFIRSSELMSELVSFLGFNEFQRLGSQLL